MLVILIGVPLAVALEEELVDGVDVGLLLAGFRREAGLGEVNVGGVVGVAIGNRKRDAVAGVRDDRTRDALLDVRQLRDRAAGQRIAIELRLLLLDLSHENEAAAIRHPGVVPVSEVFGDVVGDGAAADVDELDRAIVGIS